MLRSVIKAGNTKGHKKILQMISSGLSVVWDTHRYTANIISTGRLYLENYNKYNNSINSNEDVTSSASKNQGTILRKGSYSAGP